MRSKSEKNAKIIYSITERCLIIMDENPSNIRFGYACINTTIEALVNRSCIQQTLTANGIDHAIYLALSNLQNVVKILEWNAQNGIYVYRMSSAMLPHITNPAFLKPDSESPYAYPLSIFDDEFAAISDAARRFNQRLTFHPGHFNQIGTPRPEVFENTSLDLQMHADILDKLGCGIDSVMVVHGGGVYNNKKATMDRWVENFYKLPPQVQKRIVIENCEHSYNYKDMLELSGRINRPVVFDTHHHTCYSENVEELPDPSTFIDDVIETWTKLGIRPKFHVSEQAPGKRIGAHSDYVETVPDYLLDVSERIDIDIMVEAKAKEKAALKLMYEYIG